MGQKVNPTALRLGIIKTWESQWFSNKKYSSFVFEDFQIRKFLKKRLYNAGVSKIEIERSSKRIRIRIFAARPGIVIGRKGTEINTLKEELKKKTTSEILLDIQEVKKSEIDAQLVAENVALQIEKRAAFRRVMRKAISTAMRFGAGGVKIICSGRLAGAEMARTEWYKEGRIPLHTLRADINYGFAEANTTYGIIGIKVFIFEKEVFKKKK